METADPAWQRFLVAAASADVMGGVAGEDFPGLGPLDADIGPGPRDVAVGSLTFFPASARQDAEPPVDGFLLAQSETRAIHVGGDGSLREVHYGGQYPLPFTLAEVLDLATPFVGQSMESVGATTFLPPAVEAKMRETHANFDAATDLLGVPLLAGARAELESRIRGTHILLGVAVFLFLGVVLVATAVEGVAVIIGVMTVLGCIPVTLAVLGIRSGAKAREELRRLPTA